MKISFPRTARNVILIVISLNLLPLSGCTSFYSLANDPNKTSKEMQGHRTFSQMVKDESLTNTLVDKFKKDAPDLLKSDIKMHSFNGVLLITGTVPKEADQRKINEVITKIKSRAAVYNEVDVKTKQPERTFSATDEWITARLKARMLFTEGFPSSKVKVITHNRAVYMIGALTSNQAITAVQMAKQVKGVTKIVKLIEILDQTELPKQEQLVKNKRPQTN